MAEISKLNLTGSDLDIKDSVARQKLTVVDPSAGEGLITFGVDADGNYGYKKVGADTVIPFKNDNPIVLPSSVKNATSSIATISTTILNNGRKGVQISANGNITLPLSSTLTLSNGVYLTMYNIIRAQYSHNIDLSYIDSNNVEVSIGRSKGFHFYDNGEIMMNLLEVEGETSISNFILNNNANQIATLIANTWSSPYSYIMLLKIK